MQFALKRNAGQQDREMLFQGGGGGGAQSGPAAGSSNNKSKETDATAALDARGLLQLQDQVWECGCVCFSPSLIYLLPMSFFCPTFSLPRMPQVMKLENMEKAIANTKVGSQEAQGSMSLCI